MSSNRFDEARAQDAEAERIAREVVAGTDSIAVPPELLTESAEEARIEPESLYSRVQAMSVAEKVKLALKGNKDARTILVRSSNKMVMRMVLQNPRITEEEILMLAKNRNVDDEVLRIIAANRDWTSSYALRAALVENAKTPIPAALRFLSTLQMREIRNLAKSKNVPTIISAQAKKLLFAREGGGPRH